MANKIKDIVRRGISLLLVLGMMVPSGSYADNPKVKNWNEYKEVLKTAIINQDVDITIEFETGMDFYGEEIIRDAINNTYKIAEQEAPKHFGELNIDDKAWDVFPDSNGVRIEGVKHKITYYNNFKAINTELASLYETIKTENSDINKIKRAYNFVIDKLQYKSGSTNHDILSVSDVSTEAYAMLFSLIMDEIGYENIIISGTIKEDPMLHHWNMVKLDGVWYHVDTRIADVFKNSADRDIYFLATNKTMQENLFLYKWEELEVESHRAEAENKMAIELINTAETILRTILPEEPLETIIIIVESTVKTAETEVKKIKDLSIRTTQQNRIKDIKVVLAAVKAVEKAETIQPQKMTYVASATSAVNKILKNNYDEVKERLLYRIEKVKSSILASELVTKAEAAVVKAEKSMKDIDIASARTLVYQITDQKTKNQLYRRLNAAEKLGIAESSVTNYLVETLPINMTNLDNAIYNANAAISLLEVGTNRAQKENRMIVLENAKIAIEAVEAAAKSTGTAEAAKAAISIVTDIKIKGLLEDKLEDILSQRDIVANTKDANDKIVLAETNLTETNGFTTTDIDSNINAVNIANEAVKRLPSGTGKTSLQARINDMNNAIKAKQLIMNSLAKVSNNTLTEKDVIAAEEAVGNIKNEAEYKKNINDEVIVLRTAVEELQVSNTIKAVEKAEVAAKQNSTSLSKDITSAKSAVEAISNKVTFSNHISKLIARINALDSYVATLKVLVNAEKTLSTETKSAAENALLSFSGFTKKVEVEDQKVYDGVYHGLELEITNRIAAIGDHLKGEEKKVSDANAAIATAEGLMAIESDPTSVQLIEAQDAVNNVNDKIKKAEFQKRINDMKAAIAAKLAVVMAEAYTDASSVNTADKAIISLVKTGSYLDIVKNLNDRNGKLKNQLNIVKLVEEATKLVQKAVESRKLTDIAFAEQKLLEIAVLAKEAYGNLMTILINLKTSIDNEALNETTALSLAETELKLAIEEISGKEGVNIDIGKIVEPINHDDIKKAYARIQIAKNHIITANSAVKKLTGQKSLLDQISNANKEIDLAEDNIDVKEAIRLVTIASDSVINANTEEKKALAKLDISAARRAIDKISHSNNKALKVTISNTINSIEAKLTSDNDQDLIDAAVEAVNIAAGKVTKAVKENKIMDLVTQEDIDKAIFSAKLAIGWISDNSKAAKDTLNGFINEIAATFEAEKEGIKNEERITNAEKAVVDAEAKKGSEELDSYIRMARLKINMIRSDGPDTEVAKVKIIELNNRLDVLEGKTPGTGGTPGSGSTPGTGGGSGTGGNNSGGGSSKPGESSSGGSKIPQDPLPERKRVIGITDPNWGDTKELKSPIPVINLSHKDITAFKIYDSKLIIMELSNILNTTKNVKATLVVKGKNMKLDSKPYIEDKLNNGILVPIKVLGDELGFSVSLVNGPVANGPKRLLINGIINGSAKSLIMDIGSEYGYVNGQIFKTSSKLVIVDGRTYIPMDLMVEHLGLNFSYYNESGNIQLILN